MAEEPTKKAPADVFTNRRARTVVIVLTVVMVVAACISLLLGRYPIAPGDALAMLANLLPFVDIETGATPQAEALFYFGIRQLKHGNKESGLEAYKRKVFKRSVPYTWKEFHGQDS